ncbi:hypothetical protein E0980_21775 [Salmonella enterica subsp. enterica serovar Waycross]|nr:hypothetical protein [Salmonella enterica subsp. enterica serovar Waycross]
MKAESMNSKYPRSFMTICSVFIRLINETLKLFHFGLVIIPVILFYFTPDSILSDVIYEWQKSDVSEKVFLVRLYLKAAFVCAFAAVFLKYLCSDAFMPGKCVNKNGEGCNE